MRRYFSKEDFICFLNLLEENKESDVFIERLEDNSIEKYPFIKMQFNGSTIILYEDPSGSIGIIQDTPVAPWEDYAEGVFENLEPGGECKVFINVWEDK